MPGTLRAGGGLHKPPFGAPPARAVCRVSTSHTRLQCSCRASATVPEALEVTIRRLPPGGTRSHRCGSQFNFQVPETEDNKPVNILEEIVWWKAVEIEDMRNRVSVQQLMQMMGGAPPARDFIGALQAAATCTGRPGLIAEVKKASPSRGVIQPDFDPVRIAKAYEAGGAACLSVLTDAKYFQGSFEYLASIRAAGVSLPLLCKEFVVEAYQMFKARANGADAVLLIAAVLPNADLAYLIKVAHKCNLQCLIEVHTIAEMERVLQLPSLEGCMLGINNRDLGTFKVDLGNNGVIMSSAPGQEAQARGLLVAGESGIFTPEHVAYVAGTGCKAILVGESLVKTGDPTAAVRTLLS